MHYVFDCYIFLVRIGSGVVTLSTTDARLICLATTIVKSIPQIYCRRDVTFGSTHPPPSRSVTFRWHPPTLERDVLMQWPLSVSNLIQTCMFPMMIKIG